MTLERPMFPPREGAEVISLFSATRVAKPSAPLPDDLPAPLSVCRPRDDVKLRITAHIDARKGYRNAVSWLVAAEAEGLPAANIEAAREDVRQLHAEMTEAARSLLIVMPTDLKALIDLTAYLEKNFTSLPADVVCSGEFGGMPKVESLAFNLLRTVRLSLRAVAKHGKYAGCRDDD